MSEVIYIYRCYCRCDMSFPYLRTHFLAILDSLKCLNFCLRVPAQQQASFVVDRNFKDLNWRSRAIPIGGSLQIPSHPAQPVDRLQVQWSNDPTVQDLGFSISLNSKSVWSQGEKITRYFFHCDEIWCNFKCTPYSFRSKFWALSACIAERSVTAAWRKSAVKRSVTSDLGLAVL